MIIDVILNKIYYSNKFKNGDIINHKSTPDKPVVMMMYKGTRMLQSLHKPTFSTMWPLTNFKLEDFEKFKGEIILKND